jgi:hypothetical protein
VVEAVAAAEADEIASMVRDSTTPGSICTQHQEAGQNLDSAPSGPPEVLCDSTAPSQRQTQPALHVFTAIAPAANACAVAPTLSACNRGQMPSPQSPSHSVCTGDACSSATR